jgi:hypothetical protein
MRDSKPAFPLDYERVPNLRWGQDRGALHRFFRFFRVPLRFVRQVIFAFGLGLFGIGIGQLFHNDAASATMGVGLLLVGVCIPLWRF